MISVSEEQIFPQARKVMHFFPWLAFTLSMNRPKPGHTSVSTLRTTKTNDITELRARNGPEALQKATRASAAAQVGAARGTAPIQRGGADSSLEPGSPRRRSASHRKRRFTRSPLSATEPAQPRAGCPHKAVIPSNRPAARVNGVHFLEQAHAGRH